MLTKKHFEQIASIFAEEDVCHKMSNGTLMVNRIADYLKKDNPEFDKKRFLEAAECD